MKSLIALIVATVALAGNLDAGLPGLLTKKHQDWSFIESVGGMKVALVDKTLAVECDVSGLKTITVKPTMVNSGMGVRQLKYSRSKNSIRISLITSVLEKGMKTRTGSIDLANYPPGTYSVVYLNPDGTTHPLSVVTLP